MKGSEVLNSKALTYPLMLLAGATLVYIVARQFQRKAGDLAAEVGDAVNPLSDRNLAYRATNAVGAAVSGDPTFSLGSWIYDVLHPEDSIELTRASDPDTLTTARLKSEGIAK